MSARGGIGQRAVLDQIHMGVQEVPERYVGYQDDLLQTLATIVVMEKEHEQARTNIVQRVTGQIEALGLLLSDQMEDTTGDE